jgi:uncharacterized tellurite resistance protein B-like protein
MLKLPGRIPIINAYTSSAGAAMIRKLYDRVVNVLSTEPSAEREAAEREKALRLATAVLMIDVARADHVFDESEFESVLSLIRKHFRLDAEEAAELVNEAGDVAEDLVSVQHFTRRLHENLEEDEKAKIVESLWRVAYADGRLDRYENSLVLKISDLLYVNRARVMRLKHDASQAR